jgi:surfeit locus 1 family protein
MSRGAQIFAALVVAAAVAVMLSLGFWQLQRADWKADLVARYQQALQDEEVTLFPHRPEERSDALYRLSAIDCQGIIESGATAAHDATGQLGYAQVKQCATSGGPVEVLIGWSRDPAPVEWEAGVVTGRIVPGAGDHVRLQADPPLAGLAAFEAPDPRQLPDNHFAYALQWFAFAFIASVIFLVALRRRRGETR